MSLLNSRRDRADAHGVNVNELVLVQGMRDTKLTLARWNREPLTALRPWCILSAAIAVALLLAVFAVATLSTPDPTQYEIPGYNVKATLADYWHVLFRNSLVLALHALACVAGFMAGSSLPLSASHRSGLSRWVHEKARPLAMGWVVLVTAFSLVTQAVALGFTGAQLADHVGLSPGGLVLTALPHAVPELVALFLPLAAWTVASRRDEWQDLLAATFATVAIAIPVLVFAATWEVYVWPHTLAAASPVY
jgi:hypothetical protein